MKVVINYWRASFIYENIRICRDKRVLYLKSSKSDA
jgi:hypothetical protein